MNPARKLIVLTTSSLLTVFALADGLKPDEDVSAQQKEYEKEQAVIDLAVSRIRLDAAQGKITVEEAQNKIDEWIRDNSRRLGIQAERAARLDAVDPLPIMEDHSQASQEEALLEDDPLAARRAELTRMWLIKEEELRSHAKNPEHFQILVDSWNQSPAGRALLSEKLKIQQEESRLKPLGTQPVILQVDEDAPPSAVAALEFQERVARRIMTIRESVPSASPERMQILIDGHRKEFAKDIAEINRLSQAAALESLEAEVARLEAQCTVSWPVKDSSPAAPQ